MPNVTNSTTQSREIRSVAVAGIAAALVTAVLHMTVLATRRLWFAEFFWTGWSRDQFWMTPLGYLVIFLPPTLALAALHAVWPRHVTLARAVGVLTGATLFLTVLHFSRVSTWAWAIVALGVGLQVARLAARRAAQLARAARWVAATLLVGFVAAASVQEWRFRAAEGRAMAALPAAADSAPNVLLLILDTVRAKSLSLNGARFATTPRLDVRAREGLVFDAAYSTSSWTLPAHASMFTGLYASHTEADWTSPLELEPVTLAEVLRAKGYATGGFVANMQATSYRTGLGRGFIRYEDLQRSWEEVVFTTSLAQTRSVANALFTWREDGWLGGALRQLARLHLKIEGNYFAHDQKNASEVARDFLRWQSTIGQRPFFAFLNLFDAHNPYRSPPEYREMFRGGVSNYDRYLAAIRYQDDQVDALLAELDRRGVLRNTLVVITSDHGELFGEHGLSGHGNALYRPLLHVPLVMLGPLHVPASRVKQPVSLRDLAATILDVARLANDTIAAKIPGRSLLQVARDSGARTISPVVAELSLGIRHDDRDPNARAELKAVIDDTLHVILTSAGAVEAFALGSDSARALDLSRDPSARERYRTWSLETLRQVSARWKLRSDSANERLAQRR
jgi:arylsulfatase A-like enzyme